MSETSAIEAMGGNDLNASKQKAIEETIEEITKGKNILFSDIRKKLLNRYLTKNGEWREGIEDNFLEKMGIITDSIKDFKENLNKVSNETELTNLKDSVINAIKASKATRTTAGLTATTVAAATTIASSKTRQKIKNPKGVDDDNQRYSIDQININISSKHQELYKQLKGRELPDLEPFACAMKGYEELKGSLKNPQYLTIVDFTKSNRKNRFYVINMKTMTVEHAVQVAHGQNSGGEYATSFSNTISSNQSSLGFFRTPDFITKPYNGKRWAGLRLNGIDGDCNDNASNRGIFIHEVGAVAYQNGKSTSQGCFAIPRKDNPDEIMSKIKGDSLLFAYAKSKDYFAQSNYFNTTSTGEVLAA